MVHRKGDGDLNHCSNCGDVENWSNSGCIGRVEKVVFAELDVGHEIKRRCKDHTKFCKPSNSKNRIVIFL